MNPASLLFVLVLLSGCAAAADAPSLLPRPIETRSDDVVAAPGAAARPADRATTARITILITKARKGDAAFSQRGTSGLAQGLRAAEGSELWVAAQARRSALESARRDSADALADIEALVLAAESDDADGRRSASLDDIRTARAEIAAIVDRQNALIDSLNR